MEEKTFTLTFFFASLLDYFFLLDYPHSHGCDDVIFLAKARLFPQTITVELLI